MKQTRCTSLIVLSMVLCIGSLLHAQALLDDDTLFIGSATGLATEQVVIPVYLKTTHYVQGWQVPLLFGQGNTPVQCDSVSTVGTVMEDWAFKAPFKNNYEWDNVQTCGIAGLKDWMAGSIDPGTHLVMNLYFTIDDSPVLGTYSLDTTRASWSAGGPMNPYIITVAASSYITHVVQGSITITGVGINEDNNDMTASTLQVYPTIARIGDNISIQRDVAQPIGIHIYDATGRIVTRFTDNKTTWSYSTHGLQAGVYFVTTEQAGINGAQKIVLY